MKKIARIAVTAGAVCVAGGVIAAPAQAAPQPLPADQVASVVQQQAAAFAKRVAKTPMKGNGPSAVRADTNYSYYGLPAGKTYLDPSGSYVLNNQTCVTTKKSSTLTCVTKGEKGTTKVQKDGNEASPYFWAWKSKDTMAEFAENVEAYGITGSATIEDTGDSVIIRSTQVNPESTAVMEMEFGKKTFRETITIDWAAGRHDSETFTLTPTKAQKVTLPKR